MSDLREALKVAERYVQCITDDMPPEVKLPSVSELGDALLTAVAALAQPEAVEPVAWRVKNDFGHWYATMDRALAMTWRNTERLEVQPLFTTPPLAPDERMRRALEKIAGSHWERVGYCQSDVDDVPDLTAEEAMREAREALSRADEAKDKELAELRAEERESFQKYVDANEARIETEARAETAERRVAELEEENEALQDQNASAVIVTNWFDLGRELNVPEGGSVFDTVMALKRERDEAREALRAEKSRGSYHCD